MPLNPPSFSGQDVWYSPNVYVNQVPVALWQPAVPQPSALTTVPVVPNTSFQHTANQLQMMKSSTTSSTLTNPDGSTFTQTEADAPAANAPPGQFSGPTVESTDPGATGQGGYATLLNRLRTARDEAKGGAWHGSTSNPNIKSMLAATGAPSSVITDVAWCATFTAYMLKLSELPYMGDKERHVNTVAASYLNYGKAVPLDMHAWRLGDVVLTSRVGGSGYHVSFLWGINGTTPVILGGNQGNDVKATIWRGLGTGDLVAVRRNWEAPDSNGYALLSSQPHSLGGG